MKQAATSQRPGRAALTCVMLFCVSLQIFYLNKAFQSEGQVLKVMPIFQTWWIAASIISALFFFNDFTQLDDLNKVLFICGVLTTKIGLYILFITHDQTQVPLSFAGDEGQNVNQVSESLTIIDARTESS